MPGVCSFLRSSQALLQACTACACSNKPTMTNLNRGTGRDSESAKQYANCMCKSAKKHINLDI